MDYFHADRVMSRIIYKKVLTVLPSALAGMGGA